MRSGLLARSLVSCCFVVATLVSSIAQDAAPDKAIAPSSQGAAARPVAGEPATRSPEAAPEHDTGAAMCLMIESAARAHDLPLEFFARVIWQESRFQPDAVGPITRSGDRALGIAQFMPGTASERSLLDPFDPVQALPKSAEFLSELRAQFGNLGLAAAAYNAGPRRVQEWISGTGFMPQQTRHYVYAITGTSIDEWAAAGRSAKPAERPAASSCGDLMALLKRAPNPFVTQLERRVKLGADQPWGVQLAAGFNRDRALASYARAMTRLSAVIGDRDPSLIRSVFRSRGTRPFYQVRIGTETRPAANDLCVRIRRAGHGCLVLRNGRSRG
ncbi:MULTISPECIES: lytic transglycosylase domain-containing protein [Rhodopseudomonas]|uniref:Lytic transglycosylase n=1 Tax=Rhodopseudomonas palustris TaxID=1076 RepID=A0A0D7E7L0_RHOPL|nr:MULTISPECIES: lytic transglycosylase domain-containing protein [Rhodopseudomonas]KIZ36465.1 lytic transglycosylase [Rhodopseudomonas palustris]MDF3809496.1 lytic transglycosylase domain-containing protein [Rhodopseudomonas sp. BAL398]WOK19364.1 lytic transglycosylase domain-containing protein [Rhodopseudomonas sp. BAL398]